VRRKLAVLRALKRLLCSRGRIAFTTIYVTPRLPPAVRRRARRDGPRAVASSATQEQLLRSAGYVDIEALDVTRAFLDTTRAWIEQRQRHARELAALQPPGAFEQRQRDHRAQLAATEEGLLRRGLFSGKRP